MPIVDAQEALSRIRQDEELQLTPKVHLPPTLGMIRDLQKTHIFFVANVGPWAHVISRPELTLIIPGYDAEKDHKKVGYSRSQDLPMYQRLAKLTGGGGEMPLEYSYVDDDGRKSALDMIGVGFGIPKANSLIPYGVFVPAGPIPTSEELAAANIALDHEAARLVEEARDAFDKGRESWNLVKTDRHIWAARKKGIQERWVAEDHKEQSVRCEMCGRFNPAGVAKCQCGTILDFELYSRIQAQQDRMMEEATRPRK